MNIIKTNNYEGDYICSICRETFCENDQIVLVKHYDKETRRSEKINQSRKRKHIFHEACILKHIDICQQQNNDEICNACPLDRETITQLVNVKYYEIATLNILNFSHNYYELLDKDITNVSVIDRINLNYKDINGKTLLYCACQRGNLKLVKQLIKLGGDPTIVDDNGFTPLMAAVCHNYLQIVKYLLKIPSIINKINDIDDIGKTAIEYADEYHRLYCIMELLKVDGIKSNILQNLLKKYQTILVTDIKYIGCFQLIIEIKTKIKKYLKIPCKKIKTENISILKQKDQSFIVGPTGFKSESIYSQSEKILNVDLDKNPDLVKLIYRPQTNSNLCIPETSRDEILALNNFKNSQPNLDLIYKPYNPYKH